MPRWPRDLYAGRRRPTGASETTCPVAVRIDLRHFVVGPLGLHLHSHIYILALLTRASGAAAPTRRRTTSRECSKILHRGRHRVEQRKRDLTRRLLRWTRTGRVRPFCAHAETAAAAPGSFWIRLSGAPVDVVDVGHRPLEDICDRRRPRPVAAARMRRPAPATRGPLPWGTSSPSPRVGLMDATLAGSRPRA